MEESVKYKKIYNILKKGGASITLDYSGWWSAYEEILRRELDGLAEEFSTLKLLSQELQVRANAIHFQKAA